LIAEVLDDSPAEKAKLRASKMSGDGSLLLGDLITAVDDNPVRYVEDLLSAIEERREGDVVKLRILRGCDSNRSEIVEAKLVSRDKLRDSAAGTTGAAFKNRSGGQRRGTTNGNPFGIRGNGNRGSNQVSASSETAANAWQ